MNRRIIALLLAAILLLAACGKKDSTAETTETTQPTVETTIPLIPGVEYASDGMGGVLLEEEDTIPTSEATEPVEETKPSEETQPTEETTPTEEAQQPTEAPVVPTTEYEKYNAMSGEEQEAFIDSFESIQAFMDWYNAAKAEYDALHPGIDIGDGNIDAGDLVGGNG